MKAKDLTGMKFGRLKVISRAENNLPNRKSQRAFWVCQCDCGNTKIVESSNLINKASPTRSCGCLKNEILHKQKNTKNIEWIEYNDFIKGVTNRGDTFLIDKDDYVKVKDYCWRKDKHGYIVANSKNGKNQTIKLHRIIMDVDSSKLVDHKNWDKSDNRKCNLRIATKSQNNVNIKLKSNNSTGYQGVTLNKVTNHYVARISLNGKRIYLGTFQTFEEAVKARRKAEIILHREWSGENNKHDYEKFEFNLKKIENGM